MQKEKRVKFEIIYHYVFFVTFDTDKPLREILYRGTINAAQHQENADLKYAFLNNN